MEISSFSTPIHMKIGRERMYPNKPEGEDNHLNLDVSHANFLVEDILSYFSEQDILYTLYRWELNVKSA